MCVCVEHWIKQFAITSVQFNYRVSWFFLLVLFANESANRLEVDANKVIGPDSSSVQLLWLQNGPARKRFFFNTPEVSHKTPLQLTFT